MGTGKGQPNEAMFLHILVLGENDEKSDKNLVDSHKVMDAPKPLS